ncbi:MAG: NTP transferase domain-containing protein [Ardenticatenaceae bacterium]|nr:NTP transferase domain-containing protein [Ardenticatenaceae bacterium]
MRVSAAVMAGGRSRRMGYDKSLLEIEGQPLIERVLERLVQVSDDLLVVTNEPDKYAWLADRVRFVPDATGPGKGPLAGIAGALAAARAPAVLVVATDMPFLQVPLLRHLANLAASADVVVPLIEPGRPETLHAVYGRACLAPIERQLATGRYKITAFFPEVRVHEVGVDELRRFDPKLRSFVNANTPEEWTAVLDEERRTSRRALPILIYGRPTCEDTAAVREQLAEWGIAYREVDVDADEEAGRFVESLNGGFRSTPTMIFGDHQFHLSEPALDELKAALRRAGYEV